MNKRQQRLSRIAAVGAEYRAATTASRLLTEHLVEDPNYGFADGWEATAGAMFSENLPGTYIIKMYAEFEAGLRDYWKTRLGHNTNPPMKQLLCQLIPNQFFSQDCVDNADDVRSYRNFLVHDIEDEPPPGMTTFSVREAQSHLCTYFARLDPTWQ